ncbi:hypothetical protein R3P38DRAFT_2472553, partial [Favolaschia claudopus]
IMLQISEEEFPGSRSAKSVECQLRRVLMIFGWIKEFDSFTGNGGGDADCEDDLSAVSRRISQARKAGKELGQLNEKTLKEWTDNGWIELW